MKSHQSTIKQYEIIQNGDAALTILFNQSISLRLSILIFQLRNQFIQKLNVKLIDIIPSYQSITLLYNPMTITHESLKKTLKQILDNEFAKQPKNKSENSRLIEIPVCYDSDFSPDLVSISNKLKLDVQEIIQLHTEPEYLVHMLGFLPGFLYLGGLNNKLRFPRKNTPQKQVAAGSVGIGGRQTGIYPVNSPGGWQIIGKTPIKLFNPQKENPAIASALDRVKFVQISKQEYDRLVETNNPTRNRYEIS